MSEPAKVRLVRCPNCENLLPEPTDYSVYQCGACDAVLRAETGNVDADAVPEKFDGERIQGFSERSCEKSKNVEVSEMSRMDVVHVSGELMSNGSSSGRADRRRLLHDTTKNYSADLINTANKWVVRGGMEISDNGSSHFELDQRFEEMKYQIGNGKGLQWSSEQWDCRLGGTGEMDDFHRPPRNDMVGTSYSTSKNIEGQLNYQLQDTYGYRELLRCMNNFDVSDTVRPIGENRAELLRKLDELKDQISRSCDLVDKSKDKYPLDCKMVPPDPYGYSVKFFPHGHSGMNRFPVPYAITEQHAARPPYGNQTSSFMNRHGFYPPAHTTGHIQELGVPLRSQFLREDPYQTPGQFQQKAPYSQFSGAYIDNNVVPMDSYGLYPPNYNHHHPSCSCFHCYHQYQLRGQVPPNIYDARQFSDVTKYPAFHHHEYRKTIGLQDYSEIYNGPTSFMFNISQSYSRRPDDGNSQASGFVRNHPSRDLFTHGGRLCRPVAGGAPFLACQNCHELLQLPKKVFLNGNLKKIKCGVCFALIELTVDSKRLNVSVDADGNRTNEKVNTTYCKDLNEGKLPATDHPNRASVTFASDDFDNSGYNFQSVDGEIGPVSTGLGSSVKAADIRSLSSPDREQSQDDITTMTKFSNSPELPAKGVVSPPPAGSSLQAYFDYSNKYNRANPFTDGSRSGRFELDKVIPMKSTLRQNSINDASPTEIEISSNEYSNTGTSSLDSGESSQERDQLRANKSAESFLPNIIKKGFRDSNRSSHNADQENANVTVNGNLIADRLIKKAEKIAGPIHPGHYWYDFRAGFWGVIGGPCLGIIPPFIEEFNYPMPQNCAGGSTGVSVNGRELHPKDLKLLGSRGLPTDSNRSFILEISGRVLDADTGEELESLGKLAPTIERLKRGFGMKAPKAAV